MTSTTYSLIVLLLSVPVTVFWFVANLTAGYWGADATRVFSWPRSLKKVARLSPDFHR
jgi:hypothetical protein